jgi:hypothetical protein
MLPVHDQHLSIDPVVLTAEIYLMEARKVMKSMNITEHALSSREIIFQTRFWSSPTGPTAESSTAVRTLNLVTPALNGG